jgi:Glyoxalase-like domain
VKNRPHFDLASEDPQAEVERLVALGAAKAASRPAPTWVVPTSLLTACTPD